MKIKNRPQFTHFLCLPFIDPSYRTYIKDLQKYVIQIFSAYSKCLTPSNPNLAHLTISMLTLNRESARNQTCEILNKMSNPITALLYNTSLTFKQLKYFSHRDYNTNKNMVTILYIEPVVNEELFKIHKLTDMCIKALMQEEIIVQQELKSMHITYDHNTATFSNRQYHLTAFRVEGLEANQEFISLLAVINKNIQTVQMKCQFVDVATRFNYDQNNFYKPLTRIQLKQQ